MNTEEQIQALSDEDLQQIDGGDLVDGMKVLLIAGGSAAGIMALAGAIIGAIELIGVQKYKKEKNKKQDEEDTEHK